MDPLQIAIRMETDGKKFYLESAEKCGGKVGNVLYTKLAQEEDLHASKVIEIANTLTSNQPVAPIESLDGGNHGTSIFPPVQKEMEPLDDIDQSEFATIQLALEIEEKSRKFYHEQSLIAETEFERRFFAMLMAEEYGHYLSIVDYQEYLTDPASWFLKHEHPNMDGG